MTYQPIEHYGIIDVNTCVIEQYTQPVQDEYTQLHKVLLGNTITATTFPAVQLNTHDLF